MKQERAAAHARLHAIAQAHKGNLTANDVVKDARNRTSPLHAFFEWDDKKAGEKYRRIQANELITSFYIEVHVEEKKVHVVEFIRNPDVPPHVQGYRSITSLMDDGEAKRKALVEKFAGVAYQMQTARELAAVFGLRDQVEHHIEGIVGMRERLLREWGKGSVGSDAPA